MFEWLYTLMVWTCLQIFKHHFTLYLIIFKRFRYPRFYSSVNEEDEFHILGHTRSCYPCPMNCALKSPQLSHHFDSVMSFLPPPLCSLFIQCLYRVRRFRFTRRVSRSTPTYSESDLCLERSISASHYRPQIVKTYKTYSILLSIITVVMAVN